MILFINLFQFNIYLSKKQWTQTQIPQKTSPQSIKNQILFPNLEKDQDQETILAKKEGIMTAMRGETIMTNQTDTEMTDTTIMRDDNQITIGIESIMIKVMTLPPKETLNAKAHMNDLKKSISKGNKKRRI